MGKGTFTASVEIGRRLKSVARLIDGVIRQMLVHILDIMGTGRLILVGADSYQSIFEEQHFQGIAGSN